MQQEINDPKAFSELDFTSFFSPDGRLIDLRDDDGECTMQGINNNNNNNNTHTHTHIHTLPPWHSIA